jgi:hypothetical protein
VLRKVTTNHTYVTDEMRAAIGRELKRRKSFPIGESDIRKWALAVYYPAPPPRLFWDAEYAASTSYGGIVAPEDFNPFGWMESPETERNVLRAERRGGFPSPEQQLGIEGPELSGLINGGLAIEYGARMRPGDVITSVSRLAEYREREGRLGLMLFTVVDHTWTNQHDEFVKLQHSTIIRY